MKYFSRLRQDLEDIKQSGLQVRFGSDSDAGKFLNTRFNWMGFGIENLREIRNSSIPISTRNLGQMFTVPKDLHKKLNGNWLEIVDKLKLENLDFSWMARLSEFDHWDIHANCPGCVSSEFHTNRVFRYYVPDHEVFKTWAKLRLAKCI